VWHLYVVQHEQRDALAACLSSQGIQTVVNYPVALPFLPAYARLKHGPQDYPVAHRNQTRILSLPIYPEMQPAQLDSLVDALHRFGG
jgi:dTDP-4-amino-4,6-dideoxygalactose transaminase